MDFRSWLGVDAAGANEIARHIEDIPFADALTEMTTRDSVSFYFSEQVIVDVHLSATDSGMP